MTNSTTKESFEQVLLRMAQSLSMEDWQAMVAVKGVKFPYSLREKVKILREMVNADAPKIAA